MNERSYRKLIRSEAPTYYKDTKYQEEELKKWHRKLDDAYDNLSVEEKNTIGKWDHLTAEQKAQKMYDIGKSVSV